ncbi:hypothetical protein [Streptomyces abyssomicinicus]|uniref:hypothetical protein n=1 Tax=Streptomyces abyssomicinicus TaxID=574929 RepID=UPI00124FF108|nr:hypothetical protein [Streptomyces abyssomicinicus]
MPTPADRLLSALDPLPFPARLAHTATTARDLARQEDGALDRLLAELDARGPYERRLAALAALTGRRTAFLAARLTDPDPVVAGYALRAARTLPLPDEAVEAAYRDAPEALRRRLTALLASGDRTALAERLFPLLREERGDREAARLLPACSTPFVARHLAPVAHAVDGWTAPARRHHEPVLDQVEAELAQRDSAARDTWWRNNAPAVAPLAAAHPDRVLALLEQHGPLSVPWPLHALFPPLVTADAERFTRWLVAPEHAFRRWEPVLPPGVLRRLLRARPPSLTALGRHWARRTAHLRALLKAMAPAARPAFLDAALSGAAHRDEVLLQVLDLLPRGRRHAEVRREAAGFGADDHGWERLDTLAHGAWEEAREELLAAVRAPDAADRGAAWPLLVRAATQDGGPGAVTELLTAMGRLRNEQDPVRRSALAALAQARPLVFRPVHAPVLERIATDALEARDASGATRTAVRDLAVGLLVAHAGRDTAPAPADGAPSDAAPADGALADAAPADAPLADAALATLGRLAGRAGILAFGPLSRTLRKGQEHQLFDALTPTLDAAAEHGDFRLLLGLAEALGRRARRMPALQDRLVTALERGDDDAFAAAAELWLADPSTRGERVGRLLEREPSAAVLPPVRRALSTRRTDLLDVLLGDEPPYGRFLTPGARRPLPDLADGERWLPRQQRAAARAAELTAADPSLPLDERAAAIRAAAPLPELGARLALRHVQDPEVVLAEAALAALPWTDRPHEVLPVLLDQAATDRARVAVYAAERAARFTRPSALAPLLGELLTGRRPAKVTSRKQAVRLAPRFLAPRVATALLAEAFLAEDGHPDVRAAVVAVLPPLSGLPQAWDLLARAARAEAPQVRRALLAVRPGDLPSERRRAFAGLAGTVYDAFAATDDLPSSAPGTLAAWVRYDAAAADRLARTVCDVGNHRSWREAAYRLQGVAASGLPHPAGGTAGGSVFHGAVAGLLTALHAAEDDRDAPDDRDLPVLQRLRILVSRGPEAGRTPEVVRPLVAQLAREPLLAFERADLLASLVDPAAGPDGTTARLRDVAAALEGAGAQAAAVVAGRLLPGDRELPAEACDALTVVVRRLAGDGGTVTGLLATGLTVSVGTRLRWPEGWRELLRVARRHADPDVRYLAHRTVTRHE